MEDFSRMRIALLLVLTLAASSSLLRAAASHEATYVVGNLDGIEAGAAGIVNVDADRLTFRSGKLTIEAPFSKITGTELGAKLTHSEDVPLYKVWQLHKRYGDRTTYQNFTVNFTDAGGHEQTMTLEMPANAVASMHETLERQTGQKARRQRDDWWGDDVWRTDRNHQSWDQSAALATSSK
jgi:hypothetical protein